MKQFASFGEFAAHLEALAMRSGALSTGLASLAGEVIEGQAKAEIGNPAMYSLQTGQFSAWPELAFSTEVEKWHLGYPTNAPLLREGQLRDSISHYVAGDTVWIGSTDIIMLYQEFGTVHIPPRPVIGTATFIMLPELIFSFRQSLGAFLSDAAWQNTYHFEFTTNPRG